MDMVMFGMVLGFNGILVSLQWMVISGNIFLKNLLCFVICNMFLHNFRIQNCSSVYYNMSQVVVIISADSNNNDVIFTWRQRRTRWQTSSHIDLLRIRIRLRHGLQRRYQRKYVLQKKKKNKSNVFFN